jgi:hypothetical protein
MSTRGRTMNVYTVETSNGDSVVVVAGSAERAMTLLQSSTPGVDVFRLTRVNQGEARVLVDRDGVTESVPHKIGPKAV